VLDATRKDTTMFTFWLIDKRTTNPGRPVGAHKQSTKQERDERNEKRDAGFIKLYQEGFTLTAIGEIYGLTRERVRQRLKINGITQEDGGRFIKSLLSVPDKIAKKQERINRLELNCKRLWGISREQYKILGGNRIGTPIYRFIEQRSTSPHN